MNVKKAESTSHCSLYSGAPLRHPPSKPYPMLSLTSLFRPVVSLTSSVTAISQVSALRFLSKTHRATYKRWRKTGSGYKRGIQGRKHGNAGFSSRLLKKRTGTEYSTHTQSKMLDKLLPNM